ncbi:hypothetical protein PR003_g24797 [Phytophthora rubi]|uniref:Uncharacterized protein n=1 Tax=Phytophthora rubi TaxID=129364 RepID=A0A6A4CL14_9STRA|nr:hypothetical protein PR001_g23194 [Phytophthora rubi]KAE9292275.1 hypothetical protein PR003_g24797 [Phytophthora rubi]
MKKTATLRSKRGKKTSSQDPNRPVLQVTTELRVPIGNNPTMPVLLQNDNFRRTVAAQASRLDWPNATLEPVVVSKTTRFNDWKNEAQRQGVEPRVLVPGAQDDEPPLDVDELLPDVKPPVVPALDLSTPEWVTKVFTDLQTALQKQDSKIEFLCKENKTQNAKIKAQDAKIELLCRVSEDKDAKIKAQDEKIEAQDDNIQCRGRVIQNMMAGRKEEMEKAKYHRLTMVRRQMLEKYRKTLLNRVKRGAGDTVAMLIQRVWDDPNASELDRWVLSEYSRVSDLIHGNFDEDDAKEVARTEGGKYHELLPIVCPRG